MLWNYRGLGCSQQLGYDYDFKLGNDSRGWSALCFGCNNPGRFRDPLKQRSQRHGRHGDAHALRFACADLRPDHFRNQISNAHRDFCFRDQNIDCAFGNENHYFTVGNVNHYGPAIMSEHVVTIGANGNKIQTQLIQADGTAADITATGAVYAIWTINDTRYERAMTVTASSTGNVEYQFALLDFDDTFVAGDWPLQFRLVRGSTFDFFPCKGGNSPLKVYDTLKVRAAL